MDSLSKLAKFGIDTNGIKKNIEKIYNFPKPWIREVYKQNFNMYNISRLLLFRSMSAYANVINEKMLIYSVKLYAKYEIESSGEKVMFNTIIANIYANSETEKIEYVSYGPSYNSADGEYRNGLVRFDTLIELFKQEVATVLYPIYDILTNFIDQGLYTVTMEATKKSKKIEKEIEKSQLLLKILTVTTLFLNMASKYRIIANNFSEGYVDTLKNSALLDYINKITDEITLIRLTYLLEHFTKFYHAPLLVKHDLISGEIGIKTIPLTYSNFRNKQDLSINIWREIFISNLVTNAVLNYITPGLPMASSYTVVDGIDGKFFNNSTQKIKYEYSDLISDVVDKLEEVKTDLYTWDKKTNEEVYLSIKSETLGKYINVPISFAKQEMIFTDKSIIIISEYCNFTYADLPFSIYYNSRTKTLGPIFLNEQIFKKYIFEIIYTAYCLNKRFDIIHSDLHLNNICMKEESDTNKNALVAPRYVIYDVHGRLFKFNHFSRYSVIIDFSRALVGEKITANFPEETRQKIQQDQKNRIKRSIAENFPDLYNLYENEIASLLINKYDKIYNIFKAIDCYKVGKNLSYMINEMVQKPDPETKRVNYDLLKDKYLPFLNKIRDIGYNYFYNYLISMIKNEPIEVKNPNLHILETLFSDAELGNDYAPPVVEISHLKSNPDQSSKSKSLESKKEEPEPETVEKKENRYDLELAGYYSVDNNIFYKNEYGNNPGEIRMTEEQRKTMLGENYFEKLQYEVDIEENKKMEKLRKKARKFTEEQMEKSRKYYYDT